MCKKSIHGTALFLAILMLLSTTAFAAEARASSRIMVYTSDFYEDAGGDLCIYFSVTATGVMDNLGASKIAIQRYNGSRWVTEATLTVSDAPEMQTTNAARYTATIPYTPLYTGKEYQAVVTFYAKDGTGFSTAPMTTNSVRN